MFELHGSSQLILDVVVVAQVIAMFDFDVLEEQFEHRDEVGTDQLGLGYI